MTSRFRKFLDRFWRPYATPSTPASFNLGHRDFFLAVLQACPAGATLHLGQDEDEVWVEGLRAWSIRASAAQFEADHYTIDSEFIAAIMRLLAEHPATLDVVHEMSIRAPDGRLLLAAVDNFALITHLDEEILKALQNRNA